MRGIAILFNYDYTGRLTTPSNDPKVEAALAELAPLMCSHHFSVEEAEASTKDIRFIVGYNGVNVMHKTMLNGNQVYMIHKADKIPGLPRLEPTLRFTPTIKFPKTLLRTILAAFKAVYDRDSTEAAAQVYRNRETGEYFIYYPVQQNSPAQSTYKNDLAATETLRKEHDLLMELHSHASMNSFFSGTDDANEKLLLYYVVFGKFNTPRASFSGRVKVADMAQSLDIGDVFEGATDDDLLLSDLPTTFGDILEKATIHKYEPPTRDLTTGRFLPRSAFGDSLPATNSPYYARSYEQYGYRWPTYDADDDLDAYYRRAMEFDDAPEVKGHRWSPRKDAKGKAKHYASSFKPNLEWLVRNLTDSEVQELKKLINRRQK